ncbi:TonB-dependent receptor [Endothiovibrio diazotrophicus]
MGSFSGFYGADEFVTIATGSRKPVQRAPAVATVITAEDIADSGATDLDEVLEGVPGLHVARYFTQYNPIYSIRGIYSSTNPDVLVLVNGIPITNLFHGDRNFVWGGMPVKAISRIEVIRGPGSALYGADAFSGVINIVTKGRGEIDGAHAGARVGSFGRRDGWWMYGGELGGWDLSVVAEAGVTDGPKVRVESDNQSGLDALFGALVPGYAPASLAPGNTDLGRKNLDLRFESVRGNWTLRAGFQGRYDVESGVGANGALDPVGEYRSERFNADATFHDADWSKHWDVTLQVSVFHTEQAPETPWRLLPPGVDFSAAGGGYFADGVIGGPGVKERHLRLDGSAFYDGFARHQVRLGAGWHYGAVYETTDLRNFLTAADGTLLALPGLTDVSDNPALEFLPEANRRAAYLFAQDEWAFAEDWELTAGLRYDRYSDFGDTLNPRLALVWQTAFDLTTKLLYGRAFRAPAFAELYNRNNPVVLGNPDLRPQTIDTAEVAWTYHPLQDWQASLGIYRYRARDLIELAPYSPVSGVQMYQNVGKQTGYGVELDGEWRVRRDLTLRGNLSLLRSRNELSGSDSGNVPQRQLYLRADWAFAPGWNLDSQLNWVAARERESGDTRPAIDDYTTVDLTLRRSGGRGEWDMAFSVRNLFDADAREPEPSGAVLNDLPLAGRSAYLELQYNFE